MRAGYGGGDVVLFGCWYEGSGTGGVTACGGVTEEWSRWSTGSVKVRW